MQQPQQQPFHHQQAQSPDSPTLVETRTIENFQFNEPFDVMQASSTASSAATAAAAAGRSRASPPADTSDTSSGTVANVGAPTAADGSTVAVASATAVDLTTDNLPAVDTPDACDKAAMR